MSINKTTRNTFLNNGLCSIMMLSLVLFLLSMIVTPVHSAERDWSKPILEGSRPQVEVDRNFYQGYNDEGVIETYLSSYYDYEIISLIRKSPNKFHLVVKFYWTINGVESNKTYAPTITMTNSFYDEISYSDFDVNRMPSIPKGTELRYYY